MESTCSAPFKNRETCETENKSAHATASFNTNRYNTTRSKIGKKINNKTTIPIAPVALFNTCKLPNTVAYASRNRTAYNRNKVGNDILCGFGCQAICCTADNALNRNHPNKNRHQKAQTPCDNGFVELQQSVQCVFCIDCVCNWSMAKLILKNGKRIWSRICKMLLVKNSELV